MREVDTRKRESRCYIECVCEKERERESATWKVKERAALIFIEREEEG